MISRLSLQFRDSRQWRIRWREAVGRCRQICIWLHRAGRARSQEREMKFDRSDQDPLASLFVPRRPRRLLLFVATSRAAKWRWRSPLGPRTFVGAPRHRQATTNHLCPSRATLPPSFSLLLSFSLSRARGAPHFIRFSFICYFPVAAATAASYAPPGHPLERAGLLSSNPTPFYKYITRPSGPLPLLTPDSLPSSYRCPIVTLRCVGGGAWWVPPFA